MGKGTFKGTYSTEKEWPFNSINEHFRVMF